MNVYDNEASTPCVRTHYLWWREMLDDSGASRATINSELMVRQEGTRHARRNITMYNLDIVLVVRSRAATSTYSRSRWRR